LIFRQSLHCPVGIEVKFLPHFLIRSASFQTLRISAMSTPEESDRTTAARINNAEELLEAAKAV
jgi:hypothetical protein